MKVLLTLVGFLVTIFFAGTVKTSSYCANTNRLVHIGTINNELALNITAMHNFYRLKIAHGEVEAQPRGANLHRMYYDKQLAAVAKIAAMQCSVEPVNVTDPRWYTVGQNVYLEYSNVQSNVQNWEAAIRSWYEERFNFFYPEKTNRRNYPKATAHYTQLIWADSHNLGCEFIVFKDPKMTQTPFGKLYLCTYGPGGNIKGEVPYLVNNSTMCSQLC